jgi:integral membrane protein
MPAKYAFGYPDLVPPAGMAHGIAWIAYMGMMTIAFSWRDVPVSGWLRGFIAGLLPFGTFINDPYVKRLAAQPISAEGSRPRSV